MNPRGLNAKLSFQVKILIPVIALLVLLPAVTLLIVNRSSMQNLARESRQQLLTADAVFSNSLQLRSRQLVSRFKNIVKDPRFYSVAKLHDSPSTIKHDLHDRLEELGGDVEFLLFADDQGEALASEQSDNNFRAIDLEKAAHGIIRQALSGDPGSALVAVNTTVFNLVAIPVSLPISAGEELIGVLVAGVRIGLPELKELTSLIRGEGVLIANSNIAVSTLLHADLHPAALPHWNPRRGSSAVIENVLIDGTHYMALASSFPNAGGDADVGYVFLLSYETALQQLRETQAALWLISLIGIMSSTAVIWFVIGRLTAPLRDLRTNAEAVGSGDFTRKVQVSSSDELGQLAQAFNQMTKNLRTSHAELQRTVETLKATQAQLIQSEKLSAVGEFVAGIAHELNNPLTSVIGFGELLKEANLQPKHQNYLQYIVRSTERCHKIVQGLLGFARQHPPERKALAVNDMIEGVLEILAYEMRTSNIEVQREFQCDLPKVTGDSHQLQQVVLNILNNARQAIEAHQSAGRIRITTESGGANIRIIMEDNGPGIAKENLARVFDPFFTTKPIGKGTGLGLSLCYGIIREHGGTITAHSFPEKGASFIIELPAQKQEIAGRRASQRGAGAIPGVGKRALVIDDEEWILELVQQILKQDGFEVDIAPSGDHALRQVGQAKYELLVCDWKMPGLSGPQLFDRISEISPEAASRVIFMTGDVVSDSFQQFLQRHSKTCLSKPFSVQEFRQTIGEFIAERN